MVSIASKVKEDVAKAPSIVTVITDERWRIWGQGRYLMF